MTAIRIAVALAALLLVRSSAAHADAPRTLTFQSAIELALGKNPDVAIAAEAQATAETRVDIASAKRLPALHAEFDAHVYAEPYKLPFGKDADGNPVVFTLYNTLTTSTSVSLSQPLTGLAYLSEVVGAARHAATAAKDDYNRARLDVAYRTADGYLRVLSARGVLEVATKSVAQIQAELDRAEKLRAADTFTDIDVLRFKSAKAAAEQQAIHARATADAALGGFVVQLGLPDGTDVAIADDLPTPPPPLSLSIEQAQQRALQARPELHAAAERVAAADQSRTAARELYVPDVRLQGVYLHTSGVQPFQPANAEFLGLTAAWNVFDWGGVHANVISAEHEQASARLGSGNLIDQVKLDVRRRWLDAHAGFDALALADTQVKTAEEAYRLQKVRFDAGASTTTDVLDAETDVARGRLQFAVARYDYYVALVALARAMGDIPSASAR